MFVIVAADAADFCVGYFNLRGWGQLADLVEDLAGDDDSCCRVLVGMCRPPEEEMREAYRAIREDLPLDPPTVKRLEREASEGFKRQIEFGVPTDDAEAGLRRLARQLRAGKVRVKLFLPYPIHAKLYMIHRPDLKALRSGARVSDWTSDASDHVVYYTRKLRYFVQFFDFVPMVRDAKGNRREPAELKALAFRDEAHGAVSPAALNSSLFFWFLTAFSDCRHVNRREVLGFPLSLSSPAHASSESLRALAGALMVGFRDNASTETINFSSGTLTMEVFRPRASKPIVDEIDGVLAKHFGFTAEELDFVINYDIKYRMGGADDSRNGCRLRPTT